MFQLDKNKQISETFNVEQTNIEPHMQKVTQSLRK